MSNGGCAESESEGFISSNFLNDGLSGDGVRGVSGELLKGKREYLSRETAEVGVFMIELGFLLMISSSLGPDPYPDPDPEPDDILFEWEFSA